MQTGTRTIAQLNAAGITTSSNLLFVFHPSEPGGGPITIHERISYQKESKLLSRQITDSRGFAYSQAGTIGGDLGGIYNVLLEGTPFTYNGHAVRIKQTIRTMSPFNYKVATSVSVDGGPYKNYGNPWWRKDTTTK